MSTAIFIRTYKGDLEWLKYCLRSIHKFCTGFDEIIIAIPFNQAHFLIPFNLIRERVVHSLVYERDYLGQQISKLQAFKHTRADYIMFVDSDCVFHAPASPELFMQDGKPVILKTHYSKAGDAICWQDITEQFAGYRPEYEYMRRMPLLYRRDTLEALWDDSLQERIMAQPGHSFSEFNLIGAYAEKHEAEKYVFLDTDKIELPSAVLKQHWSWGGLNNDLRKELEEILV